MSFNRTDAAPTVINISASRMRPHLPIVGVGGTTVKVSLAVPLLPNDDVRSPVVFTYVPGALQVRLTEVDPDFRTSS